MAPLRGSDGVRQKRFGKIMKALVFMMVLFASAGAYSKDLTARDVREAIRGGDIELIREVTKDDKRLRDIFSGESVGVTELAIIFEKNEILTHILADYSLLTPEDLNKSLFLACATGIQSRTAITQLLAKGGNVNALIEGQNCLYIAFIAGDHEFYKYLISKGADPEQEVYPDKELNLPKKATIRCLIEYRLESYRQMKNA